MTYAISILVIFIVLIFWNYGRFASTIVAWCKPFEVKKGKKIKRPKLTVSETIQCYTPFLQVFVLHNSLYGYMSWTVPVGVASITLILLRLINAFLLPISPYVMLATTFMMWIGLLLFFVLYGVVTALTARMYEYNTAIFLLCLLFPLLACSLITENSIAMKMRAMHKEATFDEHRQDTIIKSRHSK